MSKRESLALLVTLALIVTSGCSKEPTSTTSTEATPDSGSAATGSFGTSVISGKVVFEGEAPAGVALKMDADPKCSALHPDGVQRTEYVVGPNQGLKWVFVYVKEGVAGEYGTPTEEVVVDQKGCQYEPHVFGIMTGQALKIRNSDPTTHNIHSQSKNSPPFNLAQTRIGMETTKKFRREEVMVYVKCDIHSWMECWAGVLSHPFYSTTGDDGSFSLDRLPPGTYTVEAWHEEGGTQTQTVTVGDGEAKEITFTFKAA